MVTLIEHSFWQTLDDPHLAAERVWGTAYRIKAEKVAEVRDYLDIREINGYTIHYTPFYSADTSPSIRTLVYIGTPENPQFMGPQDLQNLADHIHQSSGPSGMNKDYLWNLETALDHLSAESGDEHVKDLSERVRRIEERVVRDGHENATRPVEMQLEEINNEQEETEK